MSKQMTFDRFEELAMAYGGAIERWPADTQQRARDFLLETPAAQAMPQI